MMHIFFHSASRMDAIFKAMSKNHGDGYNPVVLNLCLADWVGHAHSICRLDLTDVPDMVPGRAR